MASMNKTASSYAYIALAASCWGLIGLANRNLLAQGLTPIMLVAIRPTVAALFFFLFLMATNRSALHVRLKDLWCFVGTGVLSLTFFNFCYTTAQTYMSLSAAVVLLYTAPVFVVLISAPLFKERITPAKVVALILVLGGAACSSGIIESDASISFAGVAFGIMAGLGYALYSVFGRFALQKGYSSNTVSFYTFLFSAITSIALNNPAEVAQVSWTPTVVGWSLFLGIICCLAPYVLYTKGLAKVENGRASVIASLEVVVASLVSVAVFNEAATPAGILGVVLVIAGIAVMNVSPKKTHSRESAEES